ncbi:hypothetical protein LUZ60_003996 [Juncus effusus]|nr:hypothetical protein LUZ60_003996 [Juncus effusus]
MDQSQDHYKTLGLRKTATKEEIKDAFRKSALKFHPDRHGQSSDGAQAAASAQFKRVSEAYDTLIDERKRAEYDFRWRGTGGSHYSSNYQNYSSNYSANYYYQRQYGNGGSAKWEDGTRGRSGIEWKFVWRVMTTRHFLTAVGFASILVGSALIIEDVIQDAWRRNNSGKSFEEAMESLEKAKVQKDN